MKMHKEHRPIKRGGVCGDCGISLDANAPKPSACTALPQIWSGVSQATLDHARKLRNQAEATWWHGSNGREMFLDGARLDEKEFRLDCALIAGAREVTLPPPCACNKTVAAYFKEILGYDSLAQDPLSTLIESHKRQREIISVRGDCAAKTTHRLRWLPIRLRRWLQGY